jgi:hypothetical protein
VTQICRYFAEHNFLVPGRGKLLLCLIEHHAMKTRGVIVQLCVITEFMIGSSTKSKNNIQGGSNMTGTNCDLFTHK